MRVRSRLGNLQVVGVLTKVMCARVTRILGLNIGAHGCRLSGVPNPPCIPLPRSFVQLPARQPGIFT